MYYHLVGSNLVKENDLKFEQKGTYLEIGNPPLDLYEEFIFPDGTTNPPGIYRKEDWRCNFDKKDIRDAEESINLSMIIVVMVSGVYIVVSMIIHKEIMKKGIDVITQ